MANDLEENKNAQALATVTLERTRRDLGDLANRVEFKEERLIVTRRGKPAFALVPIGDLAALTAA
jgi:prevent-host-death family protein